MTYLDVVNQFWREHEGGGALPVRLRFISSLRMNATGVSGTCLWRVQPSMHAINSI